MMFERLKNKLKKIKNLGREDDKISLTGGSSPIKNNDMNKLDKLTDKKKSGWLGLKWRF